MLPGPPAKSAESEAGGFFLHREIVLTMKAGSTRHVYYDRIYEYCAMKNKKDIR